MGDKSFDYFLGLFLESIPYLSVFVFVFASRYLKRKHPNSTLTNAFIKLERYIGIVLVILFTLLVFSVVFIRYIRDYLGY